MIAYTPLFYAVKNKNYDMCKFFLERGADPPKASKIGGSVLSMATRNYKVSFSEYHEKRIEKKKKHIARSTGVNKENAQEVLKHYESVYEKTDTSLEAQRKAPKSNSSSLEASLGAPRV